MIKSNLRVFNVMTPAPTTVSGSDTLNVAIDLFKKNNIDHLPVIMDGKIVGIVSKTDLYQRLLNLKDETTGKTYSEKQLSTTMINDIMTPSPVTVAPEHDIALVSEILLQGQFHCVPVCEHLKLVGIVTARDILQGLFDLT